MQKPDRKSLRTSIIRALSLTFAAGALVFGALLFFGSNEPGTDQDVYVLESSSGTQKLDDANSEILSVVDDMEADLHDDLSAFANPKVQVLTEILESRNDNDPRLDTVFKGLSPEDKKDLVAFYHQLELEDRNGRGTAVFVVGRELSSEEDLNFLQEVLSEGPCLSLYDCTVVEAPEMAHADEHDQSQEITLAYPQLVALRSLEMAFSRSTKEMQDRIVEVMKASAQNPNPRVSQTARQLLSRWQR